MKCADYGAARSLLGIEPAPPGWLAADGTVGIMSEAAGCIDIQTVPASAAICNVVKTIVATKDLCHETALKPAKPEAPANTAKIGATSPTIGAANSAIKAMRT